MMGVGVFEIRVGMGLIFGEIRREEERKRLRRSRTKIRTDKAIKITILGLDGREKEALGGE